MDLDLVASAKDDKEAVRRLNLLVKAYVWQVLRSGDYYALLTPAPQEYWSKFLKGQRTERENLTIPVPQVLPLEREPQIGILAAQCATA